MNEVVFFLLHTEKDARESLYVAIYKQGKEKKV